jgi:two-component system response regulator PfeR
MPSSLNYSAQPRHILHQGAHILIVEDDAQVRDDIAHVLHNRGFHITQCDNGKDGLNTALKQHFHLILLDKMLPQMDGFDMLNKLRSHVDTPVILLSASGAEEDRIAGLSIGADDYLPKPFNMTELLLRIDAILKRSRVFQSAEHNQQTLCIQDLSVNVAEKQAILHGERVNLTPIEFELLHTLMSQKNEILSKAYLYQKVLRKAFSRYDRSLDMHISNLRSKLTLIDSQHPYIKTVHGKGYSL